MPRGRLRGITNTGQLVCGAAVIPKGLNPSVASATRTFRASSALSACFSSNFVHARASDGCVRLSLYQRPVLCHFIFFAVSSVMCIRWIRCMGGRYRRTLIGIVSCVFLLSAEFTSMNRDALHFGLCVAFSCSFLNKTHPFGQECICSYGILSARRTFCASYMFFGKM
jgi:hypothetical protein